MYLNDPKFMYKYHMANRVGPDDRVPRGAVLSEYSLFSVYSPFNTAFLCGKNSMLEALYSKFLTS